MSYRKGLLIIGAIALSALPASAQQFSGGMPAGWNCVGGCGTLGANGVVTLAPGGGTQYGYVTTQGGVNTSPKTGALAGITSSATNGSQLTSSSFSAGSGDILKFNFNYVTSDGAGFADYAWARLLDASMNQVAILFTARTVTVGNTVPGSGMPAPAATLVPVSTPIIGTCVGESFGVNACPSTRWSPLGPSEFQGGSGDCYDSGCGHTGWVQASYEIADAGNYYLQFGVTNWIDERYDSGLAFDGIKINDTPISTVPEPGSVILMATGLVAVFGYARRRRRVASAA
jgi:hypothetical protein